MKFGKGWVVTEFYFHTNKRLLLSLVSARKSEKFVMPFLEQMYVDRYGSIMERIAYKKRPQSWPDPATRVNQQYERILKCGHEPQMWACYCHEMALHGSQLGYKFMVPRRVDSDGPPDFEEVEEWALIIESSEAGASDTDDRQASAHKMWIR